MEGLKAPPVDDRRRLASLDTLLDQALESTEQILCLVFDESDWMFERRGHGNPMPDLEKFLALLRAKAQSTRRLSVVLIGRDPSLAQGPTLNRQPNPMLNWFVPTFLGPLSRDEADELLGTLGRRVGLGFGPKSSALAFEWTGGHPRIHRVFGSACLRAALREGHGNVSTLHSVDDFTESALDEFSDARDTIEIGAEIAGLLRERYPDASDLLENIASDDDPELSSAWIEEYGGWTSPEVRTLRNFGLVGGNKTEPRIPRFMRWYLAHQRPPRRAAHG
jgi:hypothetical protein